ncbi:hypothetical protein B0H13DRAFT_1867831 [Mycena leptocephala]|nr:hypothetical protein B0H13DRAFT_1867831 [Mycena leptocephala]
MRFLFPSRARLRTSRAMVKLKPVQSSRASSTLSDVLWTSVLALKESADAFPPLKSAVSGVIALFDIAERAKHSKSDALTIALRTKEIMDVVADAVPDPSKISPPMLLSIERFSMEAHRFFSLLQEINCSMQTIALTGGVSRVMHLNRNERVLKAIKARVDDTYRDFLAAAAIRIEVQQTALAVRQEKIHLDLEAVSATTYNDSRPARARQSLALSYGSMDKSWNFDGCDFPLIPSIVFWERDATRRFGIAEQFAESRHGVHHFLPESCFKGAANMLYAGALNFCKQKHIFVFNFKQPRIYCTHCKKRAGSRHKSMCVDKILVFDFKFG